MTWAEQWEVAVNYDRPVVFACGSAIALAGINNDGDLESLTTYDKSTGSVAQVKTADDLGLQNIQDAIGLDDGALIVAYSIDSTTDGSYAIFDVKLHKVTESGLGISAGVAVGTYQTWNGTGSPVPDLWVGYGDPDSIDGLQRGAWRFYRDSAGGLHLALMGLHVAEDSDNQYACLLDLLVSSAGTVVTTVLTTSPNPPADSTVNADQIVVPWDYPVGIRVEGGGLEIVTRKSSRFTVSSGTIAGVDGAGSPMDPPTGDTATPFVVSVSNVGRARAFTFVGIG